MSGYFKYLISALLIFFSIPFYAQLTRTVEFSTSMEDFRIVKGEGGLNRIEALDHLYYYSEDPDGPALPMKSISILVPNGAELLDFNYSTSDSILGRGVLLAKAPRPVSNGYEVQESHPVGVFKGSSTQPVLSYTTNMIQRGYTWFSFTFSPFKYERENGQLSGVKDLKLEFRYTLNKENLSVIRPDPSILGALKEVMLNAEDLDKFYPENGNVDWKSTGTAIDYLIITSPELKYAFEPLLEWKIRKGLNAEMITVEEIAELHQESSIQLSIKRYLHDRYLRGGLKWVLMGGDHDVVPVQPCYSYVLNGSTEVSDNTIPTDLYYACFDKRFDWNAYLDNKIGQVYQDDNDLVPEIYLSRIPVRNVVQVRDFVKKTLRYEQEQPEQGFSNRMLLAGVKTWSLWSGKSDAHHRSELMYDDFVSGYWNGDMQKLFDTGTDFPGNSEFPLTASNLSEQLNSGYAYFHYAGHGDIHTLLMEEGARFGVDDALELTNNHAGIILSNACDVNAFDSIDPCLSEAFLRNPDGGGVAFFGSSRLGFGLPDISYSLGPSFQYNASFFNYLFSDDGKNQWKSFASISAMAKSEYAHTGISGGTYLYLLYAINPMGDPELPLYTRNPSNFNNVRAYMFGNDLIVNTGGISNCRICVTGQDLSEGYQSMVENMSNHSFKNVPEAFQLTITAPNYQPYILKVESATDLDAYLASQIRIYPNPVKDQLNIDISHFEASLGLYDLHGRLLEEWELVNGLNSISMTAYPAGTYFLQLRSDAGKSWHKILKL